MQRDRNGRTLHCKLVDGLPDVQAKVEADAEEWRAHANLCLKFVAASALADIRMGFKEKGFSWSTMAPTR